MKSQYKVIGMDAAGHIVMHLRDNEGEIKLYATRTGAQNQANKFAAITANQHHPVTFKVCAVAQQLRIAA